MGDRQAIVGRGSELARLRRAVSEVQTSGRGRLVLVAGEPGIGKSRLIGCLADEILQRGRPVAWGSCRETDGAPPYWPWTQVLRALAPTATSGGSTPDPVLAPLLHPGEASRQPDRFLLFDTVTRELAQRAREGLLVVFDDLHRADEASLALLRFLTASLHAVPLLLVGTYRDTELLPDGLLHQLVADLAGGEAFDLIELHGLATAETAALAAREGAALRTELTAHR